MPSHTVREAAQLLHVSPKTVYQLCAKGKLPHHRIGLGRGTIRISEEDVAAFIESCKVKAPHPMNAAGLKHITPASGG